ncbi:MAG: HAD family phosphatase [Treponema sp.]|jgi:HAD superfamily hydrolase (TIGR01509 family)|nr:HAD family phosphatase [Treponema sp.]
MTVVSIPFLPAGAIFDMDGLLLDTERPVLTLWIELSRKLDWEVSKETVLRTVGVNEIDTKAAFMNAHGPEFPYDRIRNELIRTVVERAEKEGIPCRPGLPALLERLEGLGVPMGIATSSDRETALWKLDRAGLDGRFSVLVCGDEVPQGKPAPDIFLLAVKKLGKTPAACVGFEDSPAGLRALHHAGIPSVFIKDIIEPPGDVLKTVWWRCADLAEAAALFGPESPTT